MERSELDSLKARVLELEDHLKFLYQRMGIDYAEGDLKTGDLRVRELLLQKRRPEAIKLYEEIHRVTFEEARRAIDELDMKIGA